MASTPSENTTYFASAIGVKKADGTYVDVIDRNGQLASATGATSQALSGSGAANVTAAVTQLTTTASAAAVTLANGIAGQTKTLLMAVDGGGDATLTPATKTGFATIVFNDAGDVATLRYVNDTLGWMIQSVNGVTVT
jgi:hypothetical protein